LAIANRAADLNLSLTGGLTDDCQIAIYIVDIQPCDRKGHCLEPKVYEPILLTCIGGSCVPPHTSMPSRRIAGKGDSCNGANDFCNMGGVQEGKLTR
jgi:hypothetical protein